LRFGRRKLWRRIIFLCEHRWRCERQFERWWQQLRWFERRWQRRWRIVEHGEHGRWWLQWRRLERQRLERWWQ
jgi:hypothetical protein